MRNERQLEEAFHTRWPHLWSLLNRAARQRLPRGLDEYLSGQWAENGAAHLDHADAAIAGLSSKVGHAKVGDAYRRHLSGVDSEMQLAELLCEISVCWALSRVATSVVLRPPIPGQERRPDVKAVISGSEVCGEVKRYDDPGPQGCRSLVRTRADEPTPTAARPRMMDLLAKLADVPSQFPADSVTVLFIFHRSYASSQHYIQQALFGDEEFFSDPACATVSRNDALFAREDWKKVSAVAYVTVTPGGQLQCKELWRNPSPAVTLPDALEQAIRGLGSA